MSRTQAGQAEIDSVYAILWFVALQVAVDKLVEPLPRQLDRVVATFFSLYSSRAKA